MASTNLRLLTSIRVLRNSAQRRPLQQCRPTQPPDKRQATKLQGVEHVLSSGNTAALLQSPRFGLGPTERHRVSVSALWTGRTISPEAARSEGGAADLPGKSKLPEAFSCGPAQMLSSTPRHRASTTHGRPPSATSYQPRTVSFRCKSHNYRADADDP
jgi:hypothetical protein